MSEIQDYLNMMVKHFPDQSMFQQFLLENGMEFRKGPHTFTGARMEAHMCYMNSTHHTFDNSDVLFYCEGLVQIYGLPIEHAWCCTKDGEVIDPTLVDNEQIGEYFGIPFTTKYLRASIKKNGYYGLLDVWYSKKTALPLFKGQTKNFRAPIAQLVQST